jgi:hypothetical protein
LLSLHELSTFINSIGSNEIPWGVAYPDRVYHVEYQIVASLFDDSIIARTDVKAKLGVLFLHAGLLFIYTNLRETPVGGSIRGRLIARLCQALDEAVIEQIALSFPAEVLWIVLVGTSAAFGEHQQYFRRLVLLTLVNCEIKSSFDLRVFLMGLPALVSDRWEILRCLLEDNNDFYWN